MEGSTNGEEPKSWEDLYNINLVSSEIFLKFRREMQGFRVGVNLELCNAPLNDYHAKLVLKPLAPERMWKVILEPGCAACFQEDTCNKIFESSGVDFRFGWRADYVLPEFTGGVGTDEPLFNMNSGRLQASLDRIEAIFTHAGGT